MADLTKLGKYEIRRELGKGAMGIVYEGFDPFIERIVAIKTILKSQLDSAEAQDMLNRFRREAQAAGRLAHPNIVGIFEYGEDGDVAFIAMEFIKGNELKKLFDEEARFKLPDAIRSMSQLLEALNYSHERGVVHRDIKPANIIITESGQVKVADFGIARIESSHLTQAGTVLGTPTHMSPEQFMGLTVDRRSDIYSAGVILYQFLTGERPFTGSVVTIMHKVLNQEPIPPSALNFSVSKAMDEVVRKGLAKKPEERFQTAGEFSTALQAAAQATPDSDATFIGLETGDPNATFISADSTLAAGATQTIQTKAPARPASVKTAAPAPGEEQPSAAAEKKTPVLAIAAAVGVIIAGAGAWFALRPTEVPSPVPVQATAPAAPVPKIAKVEPAPTPPAPSVETPTPTAIPTGADKAKLEKEKADKVKLEKEKAEKSKQEKIEKEQAKLKSEENTVVKAKAEAEAIRIKAEAEAAALKIRAEAEADARRKAEADKPKMVIANAPSGPGGAELYKQGLRHESEGNIADAMKVFQSAANAGYGPAMKKLGEIYGKGNSVVPRDYAASIKWYKKAQEAGAR